MQRPKPPTALLTRPRRPALVSKATAARDFDENKVNRDNKGRFAEKPGSGLTEHSFSIAEADDGGFDVFDDQGNSYGTYFTRREAEVRRQGLAYDAAQEQNAREERAPAPMLSREEKKRNIGDILLGREDEPEPQQEAEQKSLLSVYDTATPQTLEDVLSHHIISDETVQRTLKSIELRQPVPGDQLIIPALEPMSEEVHLLQRRARQDKEKEIEARREDVEREGPHSDFYDEYGVFEDHHGGEHDSQEDAEYANDIIDVFEYTSESGYQFVPDVTYADADSESASVTGRVLSPDGLVVGNFERDINYGEVEHKYFRLDTNVQGEGLTAEWFPHVIDQYRNVGIGRITVSAGMSVGGYAWAKQGFDWIEPPSSLESSLRVALDEARDDVRDFFSEVGTEWDEFVDEFEERDEDGPSPKAAEAFFEDISGIANYFGIDVWDDSDLETLATEASTAMHQGDFSWMNESKRLLEFLNSWSRWSETGLYWTPDLLSEADNMRASLEMGDVSAFDFSQWLNEPEFRRQEGKFTLWPGKKLLLGASWDGEMHI